MTMPIPANAAEMACHAFEELCRERCPGDVCMVLNAMAHAADKDLVNTQYEFWIVAYAYVYGATR